MLNLAGLVLLMGQAEAPVEGFSREMRGAAITATVRIANPAQGAVGSGAIVGRKGSFIYILTAFHVVEGAERLEVVTFAAGPNPKPQVHRSVQLVARTNDSRDLALLRVVANDPVPAALPLCPARLLPGKGEFKALAVGCIDEEGPTTRIEAVGGKKRAQRPGQRKEVLLWEVSSRQRGGWSGGPLLDRGGRLIGVCSGNNKERGYFCHCEEVRAFLNESGFGWLV